MALLLSSPIATARGILNDPDGVRYSDADLLQYGNDALDQMVMLVPQEFRKTATQLCTGFVITPSVTDVLEIVDVRTAALTTGGTFPVTEIEEIALEAFLPSWRAVEAGLPVHWMRDEQTPKKFKLYPSALSALIDYVYIATPAEYAVGADTGVNERFSDAISDYIVYRAESRDDEHVNSNRAQQFLASFIQKVKGA